LCLTFVRQALFHLSHSSSPNDFNLFAIKWNPKARKYKARLTLSRKVKEWLFQVQRLAVHQWLVPVILATQEAEIQGDCSSKPGRANN
jgi:hypothetical protein